MKKPYWSPRGPSPKLRRYGVPPVYLSELGPGPAMDP